MCCVVQVTDRDAEIEELRTNIEELRCLLENETLCKVDLQNNLQSLNEELSFRKKIYEEVRKIGFLISFEGGIPGGEDKAR